MKVLKRDVPCVVVARYDDGDVAALCLEVEDSKEVRVMYKGSCGPRSIEMKRIIKKGLRIDLEKLASEL